MRLKLTLNEKTGVLKLTRNTFCGTWYTAHSHVHNKRTVPIIMAGCITHARNGHISTSALKSDVTIVFLDPDFLQKAKIFGNLAINKGYIAYFFIAHARNGSISTFGLKSDVTIVFLKDAKISGICVHLRQI